MQSLKRILIIFAALIAAPVCIWLGTEGAMADKRTPVKEGGPCTYDHYDGSVEVIRVEKTTRSSAQAATLGGPGYEGYEVWFRFTPQSSSLSDEVSTLAGRDHLFTLFNGWYPGPRFIEKYGLQKGSVHSCVLMVIREGVCSPVQFDILSINRSDYFESK
jgi:hypothetical protein